MGQDKALMPFLEKPLIARVLARVSPVADEVLVTTNTPENYRFLGVPLFPDLIPERGALGGLYTALSAASHPIVAVIACDMPFINPDLLVAERDFLVESDVDIAIPKTDAGMEPFHAVYRRQVCLPHIAEALETGKWRVDAWFSRVKLGIFPTDKLNEIDPQLLSFRNVNTPEELRAAVRYAEQVDRQKRE
jgi:molybdopterin-guanine dinucleotide biosynthesis protein A